MNRHLKSSPQSSNQQLLGSNEPLQITQIAKTTIHDQRLIIIKHKLLIISPKVLSTIISINIQSEVGQLQPVLVRAMIFRDEGSTTYY